MYNIYLSGYVEHCVKYFQISVGGGPLTINQPNNFKRFRFEITKTTQF